MKTCEENELIFYSFSYRRHKGLSRGVLFMSFRHRGEPQGLQDPLGNMAKDFTSRRKARRPAATVNNRWIRVLEFWIRISNALDL